MAQFPKFLNPFIARHRWMKRTFSGLIPEFDSISISPRLTLFYSLKDIAGPSYDLGYDRVEAFHNYEREDKDLILKYLTKDSVFLDIGANIGHFTFYFKEKIPQLECHLFEPNPKLQACIQKTLSSSNYTDIHSHEVALSDSNGTATFFIDSYNDGGHSLINDKISQKSKSTQELTVKTAKLDEYISHSGIKKMDVIKVDIQGAEASFIKGAALSLNKFKPKMMIEVDSENLLGFFSLLRETLDYEIEIFYAQKEKPLHNEELDLLGKSLMEINQKEANFLILPKT